MPPKRPKKTWINRMPGSDLRLFAGPQIVEASEQGCQVWHFRGPPKICPFYKLVGLETFENLLSNSWPFFLAYGSFIVKYQIFPFLKQSLAVFSFSSNWQPCVWVEDKICIAHLDAAAFSCCSSVEGDAARFRCGVSLIGVTKPSGIA